MITDYQSNAYRISYQGVSMIENALGNPNLIQVGVVPGCTIMVAPQKSYGIDYLPNGEYRSWTLTGYNTSLNRTEAHYIYARLERGSDDAMVLFSVNDYATDGSIGGENPSEDFYYIRIGSITATDSQEAATLDREITLDYGKLSTPEGQTQDTAGWKELFEVTADDLIRPLKRFTSYIVQGTLSIIGKLVINDKQISDVARQGDDEEFTPNDESIPTTKILTGKYLNYLRDIFLNKDKEDFTDFVQKFKKGITIGEYISGLLGTGGAVTIDENGNSHAEFDYLTIRKVALFIELIIQEAKAVGGMIVVSPSGMTVSKVEETSTAYRCYFERTDGDRTLKNQFTVGTQARRQTFNLTGQAYYWRLVTAVGEDYVDLSKTDCDTGSTIPQAGDELVGLGHRTDKTRQAAIIISAFGDDSPSIKYYQGIDSFSLLDKEVKMDYYDNTNGRFKSITYGDTYVGARDKSTYVKYDQEEGVEVKGRVNIQSGSTGAGNFSDLPDEIAKAVDIGGENLLLNTGFTGDYDVQKLSSSTKLNQKSKLYSPSLQGWTGSAEIVEEAASGSGYACKLGNISQPVLLIPGEKYVFGFWAKGNSVEISCGGQTYKQAVTSSYQFYVVRFTYQSGGVFMLSGDATVYNLKLERGTIATDWCPSSKDAPAIADRFKYLWYIQDAIKGNTSIIGGLILSTMLQLGKYTDGVMEKVNAGISGIYNDDQDVAFWAGGTFEQAIATVQKILSGEVPADEEWSTLAKFVATHGGDIFLRGYIYALGGVFRGTIYAKDGEFNGKVSIGNGNILLNKDGSGQLAGGNIKWDKNNFLQINSIISSPFVGLSGVLNEESKRWIFSIGKFMDSFKNNFWLNMDEIYGTEYSAYIEFPYKKEWEGSSVMFFNRGLLQSLKTTGTDWDEKELLPGKLYRFVLINTDDLTKWYCQEL